ncbi:MAG: hypothetical protein JJU15_00190 [Pararhodobacter sp.]|nr:hypothetical protein [Pararhodobacter sp.]
MSKTNAFQPLSPHETATRPPALGRGALALLLTGLAVLAATAVAGRFYWSGESAGTASGFASLISDDYAPQVWLWSDAANAPLGFADPAQPERVLGTLPGHAPLPQMVERYIASQPSLAPLPDVASSAAEQVAETRLARRAESTAQSTPDSADDVTSASPAVIAGLPPIVPPRRAMPSATTEQAARAVPGPAETPDVTPAETFISLAVDSGLDRSPRPLARPENMLRLTSLSASTSNTIPPAPAPVATLAALDIGPVANASGQDSCPATLTRAIPARASGAEGGQATLARLASSAGTGRDTAIAQAILAGNLPNFLRQLVPVTVSGTGSDGRAARITLCVMPDYLALGSDSDFVRVPLGLPAASRIAERFDMVLPTTRMVDTIHAQATVRLRPAPMTPGAQMASTDYFLRHNATLEGQRRSAGTPLGALVSGHKKDLVLSNRLERNPGRVAIYGWHQANGQPIQPLSTVHGAGYADYSHGIRLVSRTAYVNGRAIDLRDLLGDGRYAGLLSDEGPITSRLMLAALR